MPTDAPTNFANGVRAAAARPEVVAAVDSIYARLQVEIDQRRPICTASGRCCHFESYGHRLYVTTVELAAFVAASPMVPTRAANSLPILSDGCVYQADKLCTVHAIRPFGCRIFFCDPSSTEWQQEAYKRFHGELKGLHDRYDVPYFYVEWRQALNMMTADVNPV